VKTADVLVTMLLGVAIALPLLDEAWAAPPFVAWRERVKNCEGCKARRLRLRRFLREYDRDEQAMQQQAESVLRRARREREDEASGGG
jgi:hypothetical protein